MKEVIKFRPHHFMCTIGFQGKGYSKPFIKNYQKIVDQLNEDPNTLIQVTKKLDDVCQACPHQTKDKLCTSQSFIEQLDLKHEKILNLQEDQVIPWVAAKDLIKKHMTLNNFHSACEGCEWKEYGVCEEALKNL